LPERILRNCPRPHDPVTIKSIEVAGDTQRGQSLIVWVIAEGLSCPRGVDTYLMGSSDLQAPLQ
jgi:glutamate synthase (NADPH) small chain